MKVNKVIDIGTIIHKLVDTKGQHIYLPYLAYHPPSSEVCLYSPHAFHQNCGRKSIIFGDPVEVKQTLDHELSNYSKICFPCIGTTSNANLYGSKKKLLLQHWKLGISMYCIQSLCNLLKLMNILMLMKCFLALLQFLSLLQISRHLLFVNFVNWHTLSTICLMSSNWPRFKWTGWSSVMGCLWRLKFCLYWPICCQHTSKLLLVYGKVQPHDWFHGGTIFHDNVATSLIWAKNQVLLGARETLMVMEFFEQWLWELAAAKICFDDDSKNKFQTQSFSRVGAHYQKTLAEQSIQTIM